jgi:pectin methylesterase-like acyl-CoA thioesterase
MRITFDFVWFWVLCLIGANAYAAPVTRSMYPASGQNDVCADTPLRMTFAGDVKLGPVGKIDLFDASNDQRVDSIDVSATARRRGPATGRALTSAPTGASQPAAGAAAPRPVAQKTVGGTLYNYYPIHVDGQTVEIDFGTNLEPGKSYYVKINPGVFKDDSGEHPGITDPKIWRFTVRAAPARGKAKLIVAADGSGDFCTVQGAIDTIPDGNTTPTTIFIKNGTYTDLVNFTNKHVLTFVGEDRTQTIIRCTNNNTFNSGSRGVFNVRNCNNLVLANLTVRNLTPLGGSQAETILIRNRPDSKGIVTNCEFYSTQDTVQVSGQTYFSDCYIEGTVDFIWGDGPCFFENCHIRAMRTPGYYTQVRNRGDARGFVFYHCIFDGAPGVIRNVFARIRPTAYPESECVIIECKLGTSISPRGFLFDGNEQDPRGTRFYEYASTDLEGKPADVSQRMQSRQLKQPEDAELIRNYSDVSWVLGGWTPVVPEELKRKN